MTESPAVSRMWRALTCRYREQTKSRNPDAVSIIAAHLADILIVSGVEENLEGIHAIILSSFSSNLENIALHIANLRGILFESIVSCELRLAFARPGDHFKDLHHEDIGSDSSGHQGLEVLCTVDVGLARVEDELGGTTTMLKPKVCTETIISVLKENGNKDRKPAKYRHGKHTF